MEDRQTAIIMEQYTASNNSIDQPAHHLHHLNIITMVLPEEVVTLHVTVIDGPTVVEITVHLVAVEAPVLVVMGKSLAVLT